MSEPGEHTIAYLIEVGGKRQLHTLIGSSLITWKRRGQVTNVLIIGCNWMPQAGQGCSQSKELQQYAIESIASL